MSSRSHTARVRATSGLPAMPNRAAHWQRRHSWWAVTARGRIRIEAADEFAAMLAADAAVGSAYGPIPYDLREF